MPREAEVKVEKLTIKIAGRQVELTVPQAKELHKALAELFAEAEVEKQVIRWPVIIQELIPSIRPAYPWQSPFIVSCDNKTSNYSLAWEAK